MECLQRPVDAEAPRLLAGREFLEGAEELPDKLLRWNHDKQVFHTPALVVHAFMVSSFEGIASKVEELRQSQRDEGLLPDIEAMSALLSKDDLSLIVPQRDE